MAQKTDLNISPYYDDFDRDKNFYKVLFKPGYPVQSRELTTLQSILQNQVESFGSNIFKEGSMVLPGSITYDNEFNSVKLNSTNLGVDISVYIKSFIGKTITGSISGVKASLQYVAFTTESDLVTDPTIYVKYLSAGEDGETITFLDGESLFADENVTYGNATINAGTPFASLISLNATSVGSAVSIDNGVYFIRGTFVDVSQQTIILDYYSNTPDYRVGLKITESIVTAKDDDSLYDNAKGFSNYAAPGADRFKISLTLTKKLLTDLNDTDFVEVLRVSKGTVKKIVDKTVYNIIRDYIAERTFDESGHYTVDDFRIKVLNSLNDRIDNDGLFLENEVTEQGNIPSDDTMCVQVSPGKAYVAGYDVDLISAVTVDVEKPRDTQTVSNVNVPFEMGHLLRVNNVDGAPKENEIIDLYDKLKADSGNIIGKARVYTFNLTDAAYSGAATQWDLYLYDIQTYTSLTFNRTVTTTEIPTSSFIRGRSSGASGYVETAVNADTLNIYQTSGSFLEGEQLTVNGIDASLTIKNVIVYGSENINSVSQTGVPGFPNFTADSALSPRKFSNGISEIRVSGTTVTSPGKLFSGLRVGNIISVIDNTVLKYNQIDTISADLSSFTITSINSVAGVFDGTAIGSGNYTANLRISELRNRENAYLYARIPENNIASIDLSSSQLLITRQLENESTDGSGILTFDLSASEVSGISSASYESFDQERYSVHYSGGGIGTVTSDSFNLSGNTVTIQGLESSETSVIVNATLVKNGIQSKIKEYQRSAIKIVNLSNLVQSGAATSDSINDGLTYNQFYGLRVQDEQISLNVPDVVKVLSVYESTNTSDPSLDRIEFSSISQVDTDAIIGEDIIGQTSGALARIVQNSSSGATPPILTNNLGIVYLNDQKFLVGENVKFKESNITSTIQSITFGKYRDVTNNFVLDKAQKDEYYDYSRITRVGSATPKRRLLVVFDHYTVPASDNGDVFTVFSYDSDRYLEDIPNIGSRRVRASDTLDFRPRVQEFTVETSSPFSFGSRDFGLEPKFVLKPGEGSLVGYDFYLPRIDRVYLDKFGSALVRKGISAKNPVPPSNEDPSLMQLGEISLPAYLYNVNDAEITLIDNRRYTMRDIGLIEDRVQNLERVTSLSLLEVSTEALRIEDANGNNRFKSGFFVDDFNDTTLSDPDLTSGEVGNGDLRPTSLRNSLQLRPIPSTEIAEDDLDLSINYDLLDSNVQKTGNAITLKYNSIEWLNQSFATRVENVNPFHVVEYTGVIKLSPESDTWVRTIRIPEQITRSTRRRRGGSNRTWVTRSSVDVLITSGEETYIRSRNVSFFGVNFRPLARHYQFLDNHSNVDFIPKLVEISNTNTLQNYGTANGSFQTGETVFAYSNSKKIGSFRLATSNHKTGKFNSPDTVYSTNPYLTSESVSSGYSQSSKTLNIDLNSLSAEAQGDFYGYLTKGTRLVGQTSGAIAYVKDLKLISDVNGTLFGSFFIKNPHVSPAPNPRILTGKKTYTLSTSSSNAAQLTGSTTISSGSTTYKATGRFEVKQIQTTVVTTIQRRRRRRSDPLAQSFTVGRDIEAPDFIGPNDDDNGVVLTAVDLFFASKPSGSEPLTVDIRTVELGVPTLNSIAEPKTLYPNDINISTNGEVATKVIFDTPIFLAPGNEYALVLLAPNSDQYEVWTAKMGEKTISTQNLPDSESIRYSKQFAIGSLFKSQNGSIWTPAQESDLKFKLYKAQFTSNTGIAYFANPPLGEGNGYVPKLEDNPLVALPKDITLGITTVTDSNLINTLSVGRRIAGAIPNSFGTIIGTGSSISTLDITNPGQNYTNQSDLSTETIVGNGSGLRVTITTTNGAISGVTPTNYGNGYAVGDTVSINSGTTGRNAILTITAISGLDTLYVSNVQGETGSSGSGKAFRAGIGLSYYDTDSTIVSLGSTQITSATDNIDSDIDFYSGNWLEVTHFDHGMYAANNKLIIDNIQSDIAPTILTANLSSTDAAGSSIQVEDSSIFETFEGQPINALTNPGYVKIGSEIIEYGSITGGNQLNISSRGVDGGIVQDHLINSQVMKYEFAGISLRRINGVIYDIADNRASDRYYIEVDRGSTSTIEGKNIGENRSIDGTYPQLSFSSELVAGGNEVTSTENIMFNRINPRFNILSPGKETEVSAVIRTTSGTSIDGNEVSFQLLNQVESVIPNQINDLSSVRIVCSRVNELNQSSFNNVSGRRSFTTALTLSTTNENLSPFILLDDSTSEFISDNINRPVIDFANDSSVNSIDNDPHQATYVTNVVNLAQPASSLKVLFTAYRPDSSDIRVLYSLIRDDSSEVEQEFELFPGYDNLESSSDGVLKVINQALSDGRPDIRVPTSEEGQFLEYEFTANDLPNFSGYSIKIVMTSTDQANYPIIRDLRTIAVK